MGSEEGVREELQWRRKIANQNELQQILRQRRRRASNAVGRSVARDFYRCEEEAWPIRGGEGSGYRVEGREVIEVEG